MRGAMRALLVWACLFLTSAAAHEVTRRDTKSGGSKRVVCYYTNWSVYRPGTAKFNPQNINPYLCTHLIYAFGGLTRENGLRPYDKYQDIEQGGYAKFTGLKTYNKNLKTMLAIGGWNEGSTRFSPLVAAEERRMEFVKNVVRFLRQNHFDGLDLDWEYPAFRDGGKPRDRDNYALLVQELREEFDRESSKTGRPRLLLTMAVPAGIEYIDKGYDIPKLNKYLDFMNILSYDYHSSFEPSVNHHSPLYPLEEEGEYNFDAQLSIDYTINHYLELGADRDKLVLGIPTYGRSYTLFNPDSTEIGSPADGPGEQGDATREKGYLAYYEICENLSSDEWKVEKPNPRAMGPYAYKGNQWVGYDDEDIVRKKATYVTEKGLGGIMYWAIDNDDFRGKCHGRPYPLIEAGKEAMLAASGTSNDLESTPARGKGRPKPRTTTEEAPISNSGGGFARPSGTSGAGKRRRPTIKAKTQEKRSSTTTSTTPAYSYPTSTPEPPTTPDPGSDFKCEDEGFFPHPRDCKKYFWCLDSGPSNLGIVAHQFTCPSGLFFNKAADSCDYTRNVVCNTKAKAEPATTTTSKPLTTTSKSAKTTTSTTTTTEAPEEEEEYEEYEEEPEEDPKAIKELIDLIKKLGGIANLEKQLHLDGSDAKEETNSATPPAISKKLYNRVLSQANNRGNSNANFYNPSASVKSSTPHTLIYKNRGRQNEGLEGLSEVNNVRQDKPQYVTIRRERPTTPSPSEEDEEEDDEVEDVEVSSKPEEVKSSGREYVNIRREKPAKLAEEEVTTPKYSTIRRTKTSPKPEVEEAANEVPEAAQEEATTVSPVVTEEVPVSRKKLSPFLPRTAKLGSVLEPFRRKKKEEEVTATTEEEKDEVVTVTTEASGSKVSEASEKKLSTKLPYLEVTRGRGYKLSTAQSSLEDESNVNNTSASTTPESQTKANRSRFFRPSSTSTTTPKSSSTLEELISVPVETVPPTTTLEPASSSTTTLEPASSSTTTLQPASLSTSTLEPSSLSTTTPFVPTVTRVVTSESESATERHRISLSKYKGFYLTVPPTSSRLATQDPTKLGSTTASPNKVEKIMEVNRITQVTFKDDFAIPSTRTLSKGTTPRTAEAEAEAEAEDKESTVADDASEITTSQSDDALETDATLPDDQNDVGQTEVSSATPEVTVASTSLSTEGRKRFRQPLRTTTTTRNPLPRSQRRRTTTLSPEEEEAPESVDAQGAGRKPFVPKRRGSYRPTYKADGDFDGTTASQADDTRTYARRPSSVLSNQFTTTAKPARFSPQYRSRDRTTLVVATTEETVQEEFVPQEEVFQEEDAVQQPEEDVNFSAVPKIVPFRPRGRVVHSQRSTTETPRERSSPVSRTFSRRPTTNADSETDVKPFIRTFSRRPTANADSETDVKPVSRTFSRRPTTNADSETDVKPVSRTFSRRPTTNADNEADVKPFSRTFSRRPTTNPNSEAETKPARVIPVSRGRTKAITSIASEFPTDGEQSDNESQPQLIPSRKGGRVVKKIKKRPVTTTTTTFEPTATQTTASLPSSPSEALEYESQRVGVDTTPPSPTETHSDGTTFFTVAGITDPESSVPEDYYPATSVPSEDFATAIDEEGRGIVNYEIRPRDELLYTQFSSASVEVADRGSHKFSLDDVLLGDDEEANGAVKVKKVRPASRNRLPEVAKARKVPQSSFDASGGDQNAVTVVDNQGEDVSRGPNSKRRLVVKRKRLPEQSSSTPDGDDGKDLDSQGEGILTTSRTFLRKPGGSFYANSRLRSRSTTTSTTTTEAPTKLISLRPGRRQNTSASRLVVNRRRKYGGDNTTTTTAAASVQETVTLAALTTQASEEPEIVTLEPVKKFSFARRRPSSNSKENSKESGSASDAKPLSTNKTTILTVKASLHHVVDDSQNEPSTIRGVQSHEAVDDVVASTPLPDLANDAVVAIHNLATTPTRTPHRGRPFVEVSTPYSTPTLSSPHPPRISTTATPFFPRRGTAVYVTPPTQAPIHRDNIRPRPFAKIVPGAAQLDQSSSVEDFEYYDSGEGIFSGSPIGGKVKIHSDGYIECLDQGNFPHPFSCKKFISCAKMETSDVLGWEYTCPRHLSFDPIGGICNWSAGLGCKE